MTEKQHTLMNYKCTFILPNGEPHEYFYLFDNCKYDEDIIIKNLASLFGEITNLKIEKLYL